MFNLFINNLVDTIKSLNIRADVDGEKPGLLLYADDLVLMAETERELQLMLDTLRMVQAFGIRVKDLA